MTKTLTTEIKGRKVLAKEVSGYGLMPKTYANRASAKKAATLAGGVVVRFSRPFYVEVV